MDLKEIDFKAYFEKIKQKLQELTKKKPKEEGNTETESVASTGKNPLAFIKKLPKSSQKKLIMSIGAAILGLIVLYAAWQYWSKLSDTNKATQYVMQQVSSKPVMVQQLGTSITSTARGEGNVQMPAMTGQMIIPVKGSQGTGSLDVTLNNGNIDALWLTKSDGNRENIIALEKQAQAQAQAQAGNRRQ